MKDEEKKIAAITRAVERLEKEGSVIESSQRVRNLVKEVDNLDVSLK